MNLSDKLKYNFSNEPWFKPNKKILLAVSGGEDSMVLLNLCAKLNLNISLAHYCYGLRPSENSKELTLIENTCKKLGIPYYIQNIPAQDLQSLLDGNLQEKARDLRFHWFKALKLKFGFDYLFTAHHANDQAETILFNLSRGSGLKGLGGMQLSVGWQVKPLLFTSKSDINEYAQQHKIEFCEDSSNAKPLYARNKIRHLVLTPFQTNFPDVVENIGNTAVIFQETQSLIDELLQDFMDIYGQKENESIYLPCYALLKFKQHKSLLYALLKPYHFNWVQTENILTAIENKKEMASISSTSMEVVYAREFLYLIPKKNIEETIEINQLNQVYFFNQQKLIFSTLNNSPNLDLKDGAIYLDASKLSLPLTLRLPKNGEKIRPFGSKGSKLISDLVNQKKLNPIQKKSLFILSNAEIILALIPLCPASEFSVQKETEIILKIEYKKS